MPSDPPRPEPALAAWKAATARYPYAGRPAFGPLDVELARGERVLLLGPSGSGKSTLLMTLTGLVPKSIPAEVKGEISIAGTPVESRGPAEWADTVAHFFQDADQTLCGMRVEEEIAFALENRGVPEDAIRRRVGEAMRLVGLPEEWRRRRTMTLSGGEKQLVALAATLVQDAAIFAADEPTAHLAPEAARRLHALLVEGAVRRSVLIVDHRLDGLIGAVDRVVVLGGGKVIAEGPPAETFRAHRETLVAQGIWCPLAIHLDAALGRAGVALETPPLTIGEVLAHLDRVPDPQIREKGRKAVTGFVAARRARKRPAATESPLAARLVSADCAPFLGPVVLKDISVALRVGEVLGILGRNGAGKSTLAACLAGVLRVKRGRREGPPGAIAFQKPETQFTEGTVRDEVAASLPRAADGAEVARRADAILAQWGLDGLAGRHPFELSQGQKRRLALAVLTADARWPLLLLDEPLAGLDARWAEKVEADIERLRLEGRALAVVTHDMDFALRACPRSIVVGEGRILAEGPTDALLSDTTLLERAGLAEPVLAPALRWLERPAQPC